MPVPHPINGVYATNWGEIKLLATAKGTSRLLDAKSGTGFLSNEVKGLTFENLVGDSVSVEYFGRHTDTISLEEKFVHWKFDKQLRVAEGFISSGKEKRNFDVVKDCFLYIGCKKDYTTLYSGGKEVR